VDAPRKRKKYLSDVPESIETDPTSRSSLPPVDPNNLKQGGENFSFNNPSGTDMNELYPSAQITNTDFHAHSLGFQEIQRGNSSDIIPNTVPPKKSSKFMSSTANNEYSILSDIIKREYEAFTGNSNMSESTVSPPNNYQNNHDINPMHNLRYNSTHSMVSSNSTPTPTSTPNISQNDIYNAHKQGDKSINQYKLGTIQDQVITYPEVMSIINGEAAFAEASNPTSSQKQAIEKPTLSFCIAINENNEISSATFENPCGLRFKEPEDIYAKIDQPFSYTPGFHSLIQYLRQRFNAKDLIKMAKSMASYRPSFIACTNTLKEEDLIFMEQCFQRTLLEYDKFVSLSGTPTIIWRRTGQIAYVSEEFSILAGWTRDDLLSKVTFIVELMDDHSAIEYFDLFSTIAYGDFKAATMGSCTLLTPDNSRIKTTCIWTLKRDVFGIPMMIIGNFLPIL
jgi:PAS domain-containing protein